MSQFPALLRKPQVLELTGWCKSTLANRVKDGQFPPPIPTGPRTRAWLQSDVSTYLQARLAERDGVSPRASVVRGEGA